MYYTNAELTAGPFLYEFCSVPLLLFAYISIKRNNRKETRGSLTTSE